MLTPPLLTIYLNHPLHYLKYSQIVVHIFPLPGPSHSCLVPHNLNLCFALIFSMDECLFAFWILVMGLPWVSTEKWIRKSLSSSPYAAFVSLSPLFTHWFNLKLSELKCRVPEFPFHRTKTLALLEDARNEDTPLDTFPIWRSTRAVPSNVHFFTHILFRKSHQAYPHQDCGMYTGFCI